MTTIIPAIDLIDGKCVRLTQGDYSRKKIYNENPVEVAKIFEDAGIKRLHLVDLDGAKAGHIVNQKTLYDIGVNTKLIVDYGGGIKTDEDIKQVFDNGATKATIGSIAVKNKPILLKWIQQYGAEKIIIGADVKDKFIAIAGWHETSDVEINTFIEYYLQQGAYEFLCTDISRDGMLQGTAEDLYLNLLKKFPTMHLIASGGVASVADIINLDKMGLHAVIVGKAFYEGLITIDDLKRLTY